MLRNCIGLTQEQLAEQVGLATKSLASIETGKKGTSIDTLIVLAEILDTSIDYIVLGKEIKSELGIIIPEEKRKFAAKLLKVILDNM